MSVAAYANAANPKKTVIIDMLVFLNIIIKKRSYRNITDTELEYTTADTRPLPMPFTFHLMAAKLITKFLILSHLGCVTSNEYLYHRSRDLGDIFTVGIENGSIGMSFWFWCVGGGLGNNQSSKGIGLRGGSIGFYETGGKRRINLFSDNDYRSSSNLMGNSMILQNSLEHRPAFDKSKRDKEKSFETLNLLMIFPIPHHKTPTYVSGGCDAPIFTEFSFGLYYGVRFGYNFYESIDFLLGFASIDLADDDLKNDEL